MGILEWSVSARDSFLYLAFCLSIPSAVLYLAEIVTILRHKQFHKSFYALFIIRAVPDLLCLCNSFYAFRLPILFGSVLFSVYSLFPNWMIGGLAFFFLTHLPSHQFATLSSFSSTDSGSLSLSLPVFSPGGPLPVDYGHQHCAGLELVLLLWAAGTFREQLFKDYRIPRIRCDTRSNDRVNNISIRPTNSRMNGQMSSSNNRQAAA
ncbi:hypothetical protein niasHT_006925 [Heterodera trifolii]|uniref:Serpentine receptor class gamma n=1 Tax=Heterodera trifolii TaxID=157864 RepID=A0ABD2LMM5_9BILA